jgi:hypothetical protein
MQGLLGVVARETLAIHMREQATRALTNDPVEDLRRGWDLHIAYGLANPDAAKPPGSPADASRPSLAVVERLCVRIIPDCEMEFA